MVSESEQGFGSGLNWVDGCICIYFTHRHPAFGGRDMWTWPVSQPDMFFGNNIYSPILSILSAQVYYRRGVGITKHT